MEAFFALLALNEGNPSVTDELPSQRPVTLSFDFLSSPEETVELGGNHAHYEVIEWTYSFRKKVEVIGIIPP